MNHASLRRLILACSYTALALPLLPSFGAFQGATFVKASVFDWLAGIMLVTYIVLAWADPSVRPTWRRPVLLAIGTWALAVLVSIPFALDPTLSVWSIPERMMGASAILHVITFGIVLASMRFTLSEWQRVLRWSVGIATLEAVLGIGQRVFLEVQRVQGALGNPAAFAYYLLPHIFLAGSLALTATSRGWRRALWACTAVMTGGMLLSGTRGAAVGLGAGILVCAALAIVRMPKGNRRIMVGAAALTLCILPLFAPGIRERLDGEKGFGTDRIALWSIAMDAVTERPVFGWGFEGFQIAFDARVEPGGGHNILTETWYDRAHNQLLDVAVATGIVGVLAFLAYAAAVFLTPLRAALRTDDSLRRTLLIGCTSALAASGVALIFFFDTPMAEIALWLIIACGISLTASPIPSASRKHIPVTTTIVLIGIVIVIGGWIHLRPIAAAQEIMQATAIFPTAPDQALPRFLHAADGPAVIRLSAVLAMADVITAIPGQINAPNALAASFAAGAVQRIDEERPLHPCYLPIILGSSIAHRVAGVYGEDPDALVRAQTAAEEAQRCSPHRSEPLEALAEARFAQGDAAEAVELMEQAITRARAYPPLLAWLEYRTEAMRSVQK